MARWPRAIWQPVAQHGGALSPIAVCLHHQAGQGNPAAVYASRGVSAHFWIPYTAEPVQHVDTGHQAWHGMTSHNTHSIGVETEGCGSPPNADPLTERQLDLFGELMAWAHATHGIPLVLSESTTTPGLNYHRCSGGPATGCPCDVRVNARAEILRRAGGAPAPTPPAPSAPGAAGDAPPFPLPPGWYYGPEDGPAESVSGYHPPHGGPTGAAGLRQWQAQVGGIGADGFYGPETEGAAYSVQTAAGLPDIDGLIGPDTWAAAWG